MNRTITTHHADGVDDGVSVTSHKPGRYAIRGPGRLIHGVGMVPAFGADIRFQEGTVVEKGVNGVTIESLLAVAADRLEEFQSGAFPCHENMDALGHIKAAMAALHKRTVDRRNRNVEGKLES